MTTEGRPVNGTVELWEGPNSAPVRMSVFSENGKYRPLRFVIETPRESNAVSIHNDDPMEFPFSACVEAEVDSAFDNGPARLETVTNSLASLGTKQTMQGGAIRTYPFPSYVASVQVLLTTDGRPLNARVELLQGPNSSKQIIDVYTEDGIERPFFAVIETPGSENMVRVVNTASLERPMTVSVEPLSLEPGVDELEVSESGDYFIVD